MELLNGLFEPIKSIDPLALWRALALLILGLIFARVVSSGISRVASRYTSPERVTLLRRVAFYAVTSIALLASLRELGFDIGIVVGAAGVLTVAIGFASQTSASNIISGLFLLGERPFIVGEDIRVGDLSGEVTSIDFLSVKLRTYDNLFVRIPNESLIKSQITNLSRFPIRRLELHFEVGFGENLQRVEQVIKQAIDSCPQGLCEPPAQVHFRGFTSSGITVRVWIWVERKCLLELQSRLVYEIKRSFDQEKILFPYPRFGVTTSIASEKLEFGRTMKEGENS